MNDSFAGALLKMGLWLGALLALLYLLAWGAKRLGLGGLARPGDALAVRILSRTAIDPRKSILVANVRDRVLVLGVTPSEIRLLTELDPGAAAAQSSAPSATAPIGAPVGRALPFASLLSRALRGAGASGSAH